MSKALLNNARRLRRNMTDAERRLWSRLRDHQLGVHFRRQEPMERYVLDFVCLSARLVVEVDGGQHAECAADQARDAWLREQGFRVMRFWNNEVMENTDGALETIMSALADSPPPLPFPIEGEGVFALRSPTPQPCSIEGKRTDYKLVRHGL